MRARELDFDDVLILPQESPIRSRREVCLTREFRFKHSSLRLHVIPIIAAPMDTTGTISMARGLAAHNMLTALHRYHSVAELVESLADSNANEHADQHGHGDEDDATATTADIRPRWHERVFVTIGPNDHDLNKLLAVRERAGQEVGQPWPLLVNIDTANGYTPLLIEYIQKVRQLLPDVVIMAGNVVTGKRAVELVKHGADIVKVGLGNGSACSTREKTGVGRPQLSAIEECARWVHCDGDGAYVCADGGMVSPGDVAKAFVAGADFVMSGFLFAGTDECEGEWVVDGSGRRALLYRGLASEEVQRKYNAQREYRAAEGKAIRVPYRGPVHDVVKDLLGGLRSACSYVGAEQLCELPERGVFVIAG